MKLFPSQNNPVVDVFNDKDRKKMNGSLISYSDYEIAFINFCSKCIHKFDERKERNRPYFGNNIL